METLSDWQNVHEKTYEFLETVPDGRWEWSPGELLGTFGMQVRHMICSQEAYRRGLQSGVIEFTNKEFDPAWEADKAAALAAFREADAALVEVAQRIDPAKEIIFHDGVYGEQRVPAEKVLRWLIEHESYHQGIFTCYGRLAGLGKFRFM